MAQAALHDTCNFRNFPLISGVPVGVLAASAAVIEVNDKEGLSGFKRRRSERAANGPRGPLAARFGEGAAKKSTPLIVRL